MNSVRWKHIELHSNGEASIVRFAHGKRAGVSGSFEVYSSSAQSHSQDSLKLCFTPK